MADALNSAPNEAKWYVVHTYSGYENKVKATLEQIVENRGIHDFIRKSPCRWKSRSRSRMARKRSPSARSILAKSWSR
jgi:transcription antitermination factor NusG